MPPLRPAASFRFRYILGLTCIALLVTAAFVTMQNVVSHQRNFAALVNKAGDQVGQVNRIAFFASAMVSAREPADFDVAHAQLGRAINRMAATHAVMVDGDPDGVLPHVMSDVMKTILFDPDFGLDAAMERFLANGRALYAKPMDAIHETTAPYVFVTTYGPHVLQPLLEAALDEYEAVGREAIRHIENLEWVIWIAALIVLMLEAAFIFRPLERRLRESFKQVESRSADLESRNALLQAILAAVPDAVAMVDAHGKVALVNDAFETVFGFQRDEMIGRRFDALMVRMKGRASNDDMPDAEVVRYFKRKGSSLFPGAAACVPLDAENADDGARLWVVRDVTEQMNAELALRTATDEAERASRAKSVFLANMSHELRTPLNAVIGFSEMIREQAFGPVGNPKYTDYAGDIHASGQYLLSLIDDILDLSRIERGEMATDIVTLAPRNVVGWALRTVSARAAKRSIRVRARGARRAPPVAGDERAVHQCLLNLLSNAVKFTPEGGRIVVDVEPTGDGMVRFSIVDSGCGISEADLQRIGRPFVQTKAAETIAERGTGLGLAITRELVDAMGGRMDIASELGRGTTASFTLPQADTAAARAGDAVKAPGAGVPAAAN
jgi:PAS domain S-box-containing protein